ncbi:hypothetical protein CHLRE_03g197950v5 [Chlamydomonas reinhardtii]|uniref:Uncharacterized protein n=1 Tax=Chlamydomonas reinhardtii TaxID=3055 RepID=A0A2K3DYS3_CHLRE|nr:uncharacterized protein CHLRE_03g197950v5 [Chlamydomonas reinhardtii]PNW85683.1 hypothetical protein CHLRE_03g197950v5 [Chlamydomonas reinhardtii]
MSSRPKRAASANMANVIAAEKANKAAALHAWPKMWATKLEAQLQLMFMPTRLHRRPLHQGTCRNYSTAPGITGVIELTSAFYRMYPNATFVFNKETAAKGTYRGEEETAASWWLKHVG